jgi:transposase
MRKIREVLRLKYDCRLSDRQIAKCTAVARSTVADYLRRFAAAGLRWPLAPDLTESVLESKLFPFLSAVSADPRPTPDWNEIHTEMRKKGVTLYLLWQEYKANCPDGFQYTWFSQQYRQWQQRCDLVMRQHHRAGEKLFVDYAGQAIPVVDRRTGEIRKAQIFVAVMGASNYTYAEATWTQSLPDWIGAHIRAFEFMGGVPEVLVPDNLASGVSRASRYEPDINPSYQDMATHYGVAVIPARVRKPKDKAKVEGGVLLVERWILARLRNMQFFSLAELNRAIAALLEALNARPFKKLPGNRRQAFEQLDRPALKALPAIRHEFAEWKSAKVHVDYHVEVAGHYYSIPHALVGKKVEVRYTATTIEIFHRGERVASHPRSAQPGRHTTVDAHMPERHRQAKWSPERLARWAQKIGPNTSGLIQAVLASRRHPEQAFRSCLGILRLGKHYGEQRLEAACARALSLSTTSYRSIDSILKHGLDARSIEPIPVQPVIRHENVRGPDYFH